MNLLIKHFSVIFLSLFIFASNGVTQEASSHPLDRFFLQAVQDGDIGRVNESFRAGLDDVNVIDKFGRTAATLAFQNDKSDVLELLLDRGGYICADYTIDIRPEYFDQTDGQNVTLDLTGDLLGPVDGLQGLGSKITRLELLFSLRELEYNIPALLSVIGVGQSRNIQGDFSGIPLLIDNPIDFDMRRAEHSVGTIVDVVRETVRDGYESLNEGIDEGAIEMFRPQLVSTVNSVEGNRIQISLGSSDYVQGGDIFYIYPNRSDEDGHYNDCYLRYGTALVTARVVEIDEYNSVLELDGIVENVDRYIQVGSAVKLSDDINLTSRIQESEIYRRSILRLGSIPNIFVMYHNDKRISLRGITPYLKEALAKKAAEFNFRFIQ